MRRTIAAIALLAACGGVDYDVEPLAAESYASLESPLAADSETIARPVAYSDVTALLVARTISVSPPDLAEASLDRNGRDIVIRPLADPASPGSGSSPSPPRQGSLLVTLDSGVQFERAFTVAPRETTQVVPHLVPLEAFPARKLPGERLAVFAGAEVLLRAEHYTADGVRLLGHTRDAWTADNVALAELDETYGDLDRALLRLARPIGPGPAHVSLGAATLPLDIVAPRTTARLGLALAYEPSDVPLRELRVIAGGYVALYVLAYAEDGRYIYGGPPVIPLTITSTNPTVIAVADRDGPGPDRLVRFATNAVGTATLSFSFDGTSIELPVVTY